MSVDSVTSNFFQVLLEYSNRSYKYDGVSPYLSTCVDLGVRANNIARDET